MGARVLGGVGLIALCFFASGALRLLDSGAALAEEIAALGAGPPEAAPAGLMAAIREREAALAAQEARLAERRQTLNVAEAKLAEQLAAFETAQRNLEATLALADGAAERDIERMTAVYESMKPAEAARIFERMDVAFAAGLLSRLRPETAAAILTGMEAEAAYALTLTVAARNHGAPTQ